MKNKLIYNKSNLFNNKDLNFSYELVINKRPYNICKIRRNNIKFLWIIMTFL